ncbi:O-antigen ligase family protein [Aneurinibacillus sp. Ricciae_BoGa-3]|uniref:O-antigen ligase family protein n=1 Tax=Aneurinibacillus sp. Ricciae_BoGa-3 TaxID=3022697 RepID=UPI002340BB65|nr:O-antigen ligase family protein [Aneurinibacillus sp. Ricciae_BoGa-3]WCK53724.1 O-antigen ligase family protein [Aneurinibacillus sp. Ricciae_BoGa-3]
MKKTRLIMLLVSIIGIVAGVLQYRYAAGLSLGTIGELLGELFLVAAFLGITFYRSEYGLYLFALSLPILTYRPLLALIVVFVLVLFVTEQNYGLMKANLKNHLNFAVFLFLVVLLITALTSANVKESLTNFGLYYFVSFLLYILIVTKVTTREVLYRFIVTLILSAALVSVYGIYQYFTLDFTSASWVDVADNPGLSKRIFATFENPNLFVQYLIMILPFNFALIFYAKTWGNRVLFSAQFLIIFAAIILTYSRGGWYGVFMALALVACMISRRIVALGLLIAAGAVGLHLVPDVIMNRLASAFNPTKDTSSDYRFKMWGAAFAMIRDFWVTGIGSDLTTFKKVYTDYMLPDIRVNHFHNIYIMNFVTGGIMAILSLLYMFYQSFKTPIIALFMNNGKDKFLSYTAKAGIGSLIAIAFAGMTEDVWHQYRVDFMFWILLGILAAVYNMIRSQEENITDEAK